MPMSECDEFGRTKLHYVAVNLPSDRHADETLRLIRMGYDPNAQDEQGGRLCTSPLRSGLKLRRTY